MATQRNINCCQAICMEEAEKLPGNQKMLPAPMRNGGAEAMNKKNGWKTRLLSVSLWSWRSREVINGKFVLPYPPFAPLSYLSHLYSSSSSNGESIESESDSTVLP